MRRRHQTLCFVPIKGYLFSKHVQIIHTYIHIIAISVESFFNITDTKLDSFFAKYEQVQRKQMSNLEIWTFYRNFGSFKLYKHFKTKTRSVFIIHRTFFVNTIFVSLALFHLKKNSKILFFLAKIYLIYFIPKFETPQSILP